MIWQYQTDDLLMKYDGETIFAMIPYEGNMIYAHYGVSRPLQDKDVAPILKILGDVFTILIVMDETEGSMMVKNSLDEYFGISTPSS